VKNGINGSNAPKTLTKLWRVRMMKCRIIVRLFTVTLELYFCSSEVVPKILQIPNIVTPALKNVKASHKTYVVVYQALAYH
jgi:hypothetical protein